LELATTDDIRAFVDAQSDWDFTVADEPRDNLFTCDWDLDFPGYGATYVGVGIITPEEAQQQQDAAADQPGAELVEVPDLGDEAVYLYLSGVGDLLHVTVGDKVLVVSGGELNSYTPQVDEEPQVPLAALAEIVVPRV